MVLFFNSFSEVDRVDFFSKALDLNFWGVFSKFGSSPKTSIWGCFEKVKAVNSGVYVLRCLLRDTKKVPKDPLVCPFAKGSPRTHPTLRIGFFDHQSYSSEKSGFLIASSGEPSMLRKTSDPQDWGH